MDPQDEDDILSNPTPTPDVHRSNTTRSTAATWALSSAIAGERIFYNVPRGLFSKRSRKGDVPTDASPNESSWLQMIEQALGYDFEDPNLLAEALESEGSGVGSVGQGDKMRTFDRGNKGLSRIGDVVVKLVQVDVAYRTRISEDDEAYKTKKLLSESNLIRLGRGIGLDAFVRPPMPLSEKQRKNLITKMTKKVDKNKLLADAVLAVIAAIYMDGGFEAVKKVVLNLGLFIEKKE